MQLTDQETIERGLAAASLLSDPTFQSILKALTIDCFASFTETKPDELRKREDAYNLHRGLQAIEAELIARVQSKDQVADRIDAINAEPDEDTPVIIQGNNDQ